MNYLDNFDREEFKLFRKYNNFHERKIRHIDTYTICEDNDIDFIIKYNKKSIKKDTIEQINKHCDKLDLFLEKSDDID